MNRIFFIVTNEAKDADHHVTNQVIDILERAGKKCIQCSKDEKNNIKKCSIPEELDCAIVIGGDGSFIEVARALQGRNIPILGINMGTLGYLTEVELSYLEESLEQLLREEYMVEDRMMLQGTLNSGMTEVALNDIVVSRKGALRVIHFCLYVNGELLNSYEADGVIISTPTGSTAYNLSAGGPIVKPTASMIVITPICPHALNTSSVVLSSDDEIVIEIGVGKHGAIEEAFVTFDGADIETMITGDTVKICRYNAATKIIKLSKDSFLETLRRKMKGN